MLVEPRLGLAPLGLASRLASLGLASLGLAPPLGLKSNPLVQLCGPQVGAAFFGKLAGWLLIEPQIVNRGTLESLPALGIRLERNCGNVATDMLHANNVGEVGQSACWHDFDQCCFRNTASPMLAGFAEQQ